GAALYSGITPLTEVFSCAPDANTQALLVTRNSGSIAGNGAAWLAYLNAGGIIITEFQNPEAVYNEIYGTAYTSEFVGDCQDNVMPSTILNPSDPFWLANPLTPVGPTEDSCGSDLQDVVDGEGGAVVALGARDDGSVSLAYRTQGSGVLFLSGADWQDGQTSYTDSSRSLFGGMIVARLTAAVSAVPVPALPLWLLGVMGALLAGLGLRKLRKA
ncbi:MAG: hypothetical protein RJQ10_14360, partial [Haliea sp.]|uniref:hypothetical protein n=1 Tax=Haliea sp. TaxID=1932666 RepID=UPI0032ED8EBB